MSHVTLTRAESIPVTSLLIFVQQNAVRVNRNRTQPSCDRGG